MSDRREGLRQLGCTGAVIDTGAPELRGSMIARIWRGATRAADAATYTKYIEDTGLREYKETPGNLGAYMLQRTVDAPDGKVAEFVVLSFWESMDAIERFAGADPTRAVFYPEDDRYLVRRELTVDHYDVVAPADG